jgi:V-type H+-transporting ATPase subunit E
MTMFIRQEAMEKAKEIQIKADEEFAIEKSKLVRQETASIDASYEKKFKQASMSQQITRSTLSNKTRLRVLSARQELLDELFDKATEKLGQFTKDSSKYQDTTKNLILEGLYALNEGKVLIRARKADYDVVKKAMEGAKSDYKENTDSEVELQLDEKNPLPEDSYVCFDH